MATYFVASVELVSVVCCNCSTTFAMTADFERRRRADHLNFYCPAGHPQHFTGPSEESKLRQEVERQRQIAEAERARAARIQGERDQVARAHNRMRQRVMNGVCPCCNRTFQNLLQHMKTEHAGELNLGTVRHAFGMTQHQVAEEIGVTSAHVSLYERGRPVPGYAKSSIENWLDAQASGAQR